LNDL
jgi:hypothetical protein